MTVQENSPNDQEVSPGYSDDVHILQFADKKIFLVGTAHISQDSIDLVREVIEGEEQDCVCVELD